MKVLPTYLTSVVAPAMQHRPVIVQLDGITYTATHQPAQHSGNFMRQAFWSYEKRTATPEHRLLAGGPLQSQRDESLWPEQVLQQLTAMAVRECGIH